MKLTVLVDNNTLIDRYFIGEPGVSYLIQDEDKQILFDTGYSNAFIINAQKLGLNLLKSDYIVLSHGHLDHTWGLEPLIKVYTEAKLENLNFKRPTIIAHNDVFLSKICEGEEIGSNISEDKAKKHFNLQLTKEPVWLTKDIVFLGEIERTNDFENQKPVGKILTTQGEKDDFLFDDSAIVYKSKKGLVIITGCSHSGICNIIEYAKKVCKEEKVFDVIGGFHLMNPSSNHLEKTLNYFEKLKPEKLHACHCVDLNSKIALSKVANLEEVGSGLILNNE
jgi:7,8-dihydropterin-6-yl-methyl-4-(beta-D-ribofuranosyl)aminobenzene 5'-phosphate synthase